MTETSHQTSEPHQGPAAGHVVPFKILVRVWGTLLALTLLTVGVAAVDLGRLNLEIALLIAIVKASLVLLFFMHMRYDRPMNAIVFVTALFFASLFIYITLMDTRAYQPNTIPGFAPAISQPAPK